MKMMVKEMKRRKMNFETESYKKKIIKQRGGPLPSFVQMTSSFRRLAQTIYPIGPGIYQNQMKYPFGQKRPIMNLDEGTVKYSSR